MATVITDHNGYIKVVTAAHTNYITKPFDVSKFKSDEFHIKNAFEKYLVDYSDVSSPTSSDRDDLISQLMEFSGGGSVGLSDISDNVKSKINRIRGAANYNRAVVVDGTEPANIITVTHTGTTEVGAETIIETITYVDPAVNDSPVTNIAYT